MKTIVVTDIHGCLREFVQLLGECDYDPASDNVIACGDLVEKGPHSKEVVEYFMARPSFSCIKGNHEESVIRYWNHERKVENGSQPNNPMRSSDDRKKVVDSLEEAHVDYLKSLPLYLTKNIASQRFLFIHGGLFPNKSPETMDSKLICRLRYIREKEVLDGYRINLSYRSVQPGTEKSEDKFWADLYGGEHGFAFYGHQPSKGSISHWKHACGLDTGAVYGEKLSACVIGEDGQKTFKQVGGKRYCESPFLHEKTNIEGAG